MAPPRSLPDLLGPWRPLPIPRRRRQLEATSELAGGPATGSVSNFTMETQGKTKWCWAAVAVSVARKYDPGSTWSQCSLATAFYANRGGYDCCGEGGGACNLSQALGDVLQVTGNLASKLNAALSYEKTCDEVTADRALCVRIGWRPSLRDGHVVAVAGFRPGASGEQYLDVLDPDHADDDSDNFKQMSFEQFRDNYNGRGEWTWTYYTKS